MQRRSRECSTIPTTHVPGAHVTAAWKGGSADIEESARRVDQYAAELKDKWGVTIVDSIGQLCPEVDGLLLESVDGRSHLEQFRQAVPCGKPIFIDKPSASTLADAREIARLARDKGIPWFSASSLRYRPIAELRSPDVISAIVWRQVRSSHTINWTFLGTAFTAWRCFTPFSG
ncbi:MAG: Gfo/Idh/MocA family oxidoreductase [Bryobacteraceae bacterium]